MLPLPPVYLPAHSLQLGHEGGVRPAGLVTSSLLDSRPVLVDTGELSLWGTMVMNRASNNDPLLGPLLGHFPG